MANFPRWGAFKKYFPKWGSFEIFYMGGGGGCFLRKLHGKHSKPSLPMASLLSISHVARKTLVVMAISYQLQVASSSGESVLRFGNH